MNRAAAFILSLMFLGLQVMSSAPVPFPTAKANPCCGCHERACCVSESAPADQPRPAAPAPANPHHELSWLFPALTLWTLPANLPSPISCSDSASLRATAVPLFTRHCAFLI